MLFYVFLKVQCFLRCVLMIEIGAWMAEYQNQNEKPKEFIGDAQENSQSD